MIIVALGANLPSRFGSPETTLRKALEALNDAGIRVLDASSIWLTAPVPVSDQPWYRNMAVSVETDKSPYELLETLQAIESRFGRVRTVRNAPRLLDLDLIAYGDTVLDRPELIVPHPRMHRRAFVLLPMREVIPDDWFHPVLGLSLDQLIANLPAGQEARAAESA